MMNFNCPVCNKAGLPDYTASQTICPQCNSDLKPFLLLHSISKPKSPKTNLFVIGVVIFVACLFAILYFYSLLDRKQITSENSKTILRLQDSIRLLNSTIKQKPNEPPAIKPSEKEIIVHYKVRNGDCPVKIAGFFYNDWKMYKKIEVDNNLQQPYILKVGQILSIKIKQE